MKKSQVTSHKSQPKPFSTFDFRLTTHAGIVLVNVLIFATIAITVTTALVNWGAAVLRTTRTLDAREQAFQVAEAGIDYYRWHLAHAPTDYKDGTGVAGPYYHTVTDADGDTVGQYALVITPPLTGSTIVKVRSTGTTTADATVSRTIQATLAIPSLAKYAVVANADMRFGEGTEVFGPIHSNGGVRFDGLAHNIVTSGVTSYDDPDHSESGADKLEFGVHTHLDIPVSNGTTDTYRPNETPPATMPTRADVFIAGRQFPVPTFDFNGLTADLSSLKTQATTSGSYFAASGAQGYHIVLNTNDTFTVYKVNSVSSLSGSCSSDSNSSSYTGWGSWSIATQGSVLGTYAFPVNGIIFVEDNLWIDGSINTARLTIAAGVFPDNVNTRKNITVNGNLTYTNYDGQDVIALIAQNNINVGYNSLDTQRIDAALIAQNGRVGRYLYASSCGSSYGRNTLTLYGMIATNQRYGFAWTGSSFNCGGSIGNTGGGYCTRNITYDPNLLYGPPPSFPLTSSQYTTISWQEI